MTAEPELIDLEAEFISRRPAIESFINRQVRCPTTASDIASEMYLKLRRLSATFTSTGEAVTYLYRMARTMSIDHNRVQNRRSEILYGAAEDLQPPRDQGPESAVAAMSEMRVVESALAELPQKCREILYLSRVYGHSHGEIAERLGVSKSLVEKYVAMALTHCRQRLTEVAEVESEQGKRRLGSAFLKGMGKAKLSSIGGRKN